MPSLGRIFVFEVVWALIVKTQRLRRRCCHSLKPSIIVKVFMSEVLSSQEGQPLWERMQS